MSDWTTEEHDEVLEAFEKHVKDTELPFGDLGVNGQVWKLMFAAFKAGYKYGVYKH